MYYEASISYVVSGDGTVRRHIFIHRHVGMELFSIIPRISKHAKIFDKEMQVSTDSRLNYYVGNNANTISNCTALQNTTSQKG